MNKLTDHAKTILRALCDDKVIEDETNYGHMAITHSLALRVLSSGGGQRLRIKPETRSINGKEFLAPVDSADFIFTPKMIEVFEGFTWTDRKDRDTAYQAIVAALEGKNHV